MTITVGQIRLGVLHQMREFSNAGQVQSASDVKDYELSIIPLLNIYVPELATTTHKLERKFEISHNMPTNQLGLINWNENKIHTGGVDDIFSATGSKGFSIMASGRFSYLVQEQILGVWTTIDSYTHTPTSGEGDVNKKAKLTLASTTNNVRIVFNSAYRHSYKWVALFSDSFYDDSEVPIFDPYVPYNLPSDYFQLKEVKFAYSDRQFESYNGFKTNDTTATKQIKFNWYEKGEYIIHYYAYPAELETPNPNNISASDSLVVDIADECKATLIHRICATLLRDENAYMSDVFRDESQIAKAELVQNDNFSQGEQGIILNSNW